MSHPGIDWQQTISALHASGRKAALAITGGGSGAIGELLRIPGGSRLLLEAQVPYDEGALRRYIHGIPAQACSADTAMAMARAALERAVRLAPDEPNAVGLGATAALASDRPRRGEHRFHVACADALRVAHCTIVLAKGRRDRAGEEDVVARAIILWLARFCGVVAPPVQRLLDADEHYAETEVRLDDAIDRLLAGGVDRVTVQPDGQMVVATPPPLVLMPGSFNPMHAGHLRLAAIAEEVRRQPLAFEISVTNVDKPPLASRTIRDRLTQFTWKAPVELTRAPTFVEKSRIFPKVTFVIGADTAERLIAPKYYGGDAARMHAALEEMGQRGNSFLVAVRVDPAGRLVTLGDVAVPRRYADLFSEIPESRFRLDTSSSHIRARADEAKAREPQK